MADLHDPVETGMPKRVQFSIAAVLALLVVVWLLPRATRKPTPVAASSSPTTKPAGGPTKSGSDRESDLRLETILNGLDPELVVISSERRERVTELSQWASEFLIKGEAAKIQIDEAANKAAFS